MGPARQASRQARLGLIALSVALLFGCTTSRDGLGARYRGHLHVLITSPSNEGLNKGLEEGNERTVKLLVQQFRKLHPHVRVSTGVVPEQELEGLLSRRQAMGLAPDLLLTSSTMARQLADANLSSRQTLPPQLIAQLRPDALASLRRADGSLDGVPMALMPDLACFNRRTTPSPPLTITALEQLEQRGLESGMAIEGRHLFWTAGSFGAQEAISQLLAGEPVTPARRAAIQGWLNWLQLANQTKGVFFLNSIQQLMQELVLGRLDWVMCNSASLPRLREAMGADLGVALLPAGPAGKASPIRRVKVWVQSRRIPEQRRRLADGLVRFSVQTPFQSTFGLQGTGVPVNRLLAPQLNHQDLQIRTMAWATQPSLNGDRFQERISRPLGLIPAMNGVLRQIIDADLEPEEGVNRFLALLQRKGKP